MDIDLSAFKVLIKKVFPPEKCVFTVDLNRNGDPDALLIRALNLVFPFEMPDEISIDGVERKDVKAGNFDISSVFQIFLDGEKIDLSKKGIDNELIQERFVLVHNMNQFTFLDIIKGHLGGRTIALGDTIDILLRMDKSNFKRLTEGNHKFRIESTFFPTLDVFFTLTKKNFNVNYPPETSD